MLQVARLSRNTLGNSLELVSKFLKSTACAGGGFSNRQGQVDLYYSAFAADAILAVDESWDSTELEPWLMQYGSGSSLDFVHLCCLVRLWAACGKRRCPSSMSDSFVERLETFRSSDGGFSSRLGATSGTAYGSFLALGAYGDLGRELSNPAGIEHSLASLKTADGGWSNEPRRLVGSTAATAAAVVVMHSLGQSIDPDPIRWLLEQRHATGGFVAAPHCMPLMRPRPRGDSGEKEFLILSTLSGLQRERFTVLGRMTFPMPSTPTTVLWPSVTRACSPLHWFRIDAISKVTRES